MAKFRVTWIDEYLGGKEEMIEADVRIGAQRIWSAHHAPNKIADHSVKYTLIVTCCKEEMPCDNFRSTCRLCGADYNSSGQRLAPRSQWGKETGEHWSECY